MQEISSKIRIKKSTLVIVLVLGFIALNLTFFVGYQLLHVKSTNIPAKTDTTSQSSSVKKNVGPEAPRVELLRLVPSSAASKEKQDQNSLLMTNKRDTAIIFIEDKCITSPTVANIQSVSTFKLNNEDKIDHTLVIDSLHTYHVKSGDMVTIKTNEFQKDRLYSYTCDATNSIAGYIYIPE